MFELTIKGDTLAELASNLLTMADQFQTTVLQAEAPKSRRGKRTAQDLEPQRPETPPVADEEEDDEELKRELNAPAEPMPETAKQVVDAGTGQPAPATTTVKMTKDDVKVAATRLAAKDATKLGEILKSYGATKLSEVADDKLADFASDVVEALS